jgi:oligopeptidase A
MFTTDLSANPLYAIPYLPAFDRMAPEHAAPAVRARLAEAEAAVARLEETAAPTWDGLMDPLYRACHPLYDAWGLISHLLSVMNGEAWRQAHDALQPELVAFGLRVAQSPRLYQGYLALRASDREAPHLTGPRRRILESAIRGAEQAGVGLAGAPRQRFNAIQQELAGLATSFSNHLLDAVKTYSLWVRDPQDLNGLPAAWRAAAAQAARDAGEAAASAEKGPWRVTLDAAVLVPFLKHARNRRLREEIYRAHVTRASSGELDNRALVERTLALRHEMAGLLGYPTYAHLSLTRKMAPDIAAVDQLTADLAVAAQAPARRDNADLLAFARANGFEQPALAPWDYAFWAERLREQRYAYSEEELRPYFPFPRVLEGLFALTERLFGIRVVAADGTAPVWHPDVRFFQVRAADGEPLASFYLDPYSRPATKRGGAWMNEFRTRDRQPDGTRLLPLAVLVCNQTLPADAQPALMRFDEVTTLFHEFGHALQHMLTTVEEPEASGINNIEWDAVELASQFMENWCHDRATLKGLSRHVATGAVLPDDLFARILAAKNYRAAPDLLRQLFLGALDMELHARYPGPAGADAEAVKCAVAARLLPVPLLPEDRFLCGFSHIFAGAYAAGYYGYKWAEVLAADAFATFEEAGLDQDAAVAAAGRRFRDTVLALGGGTHPMAVFQAFRGRPPQVDALLRHAGLLAVSATGPQASQSPPASPEPRAPGRQKARRR